MKVTAALFIIVLTLTGCTPMPTRVVYVPVPYIPAQGGTVQQTPATRAYVAPVYPVYQTPMYRNFLYCPGPWCPRQQFWYGGGGGGSYFFFHRHGHGGRW